MAQDSESCQRSSRLQHLLERQHQRTHPWVEVNQAERIARRRTLLQPDPNPPGPRLPFPHALQNHNPRRFPRWFLRQRICSSQLRTLSLNLRGTDCECQCFRLWLALLLVLAVITRVRLLLGDPSELGGMIESGGRLCFELQQRLHELAGGVREPAAPHPPPIMIRL